MVWLPTLRLEVVKVATPPPSGAVPIGLPPSTKVTVPVGVPGAGGTADTVAVKVTAGVTKDGFADDVTVVTVLPLLLVKLNGAEVAPTAVVFTLYEPATAFAVALVLTCPPAIVTAAVVVPPVSVADAPEPGAVNVTRPPLTGSLPKPVIEAINGERNADPMITF